MITKTEERKLIKDFVAWGRGFVERAWFSAQLHGVLCSSHTYSTGDKGCPMALAVGWTPGMSNQEAFRKVQKAHSRNLGYSFGRCSFLNEIREDHMVLCLGIALDRLIKKETV